MDYTRLLDHTRTQQAAMLDVVEELVGYESPSTDKSRLDALAGQCSQDDIRLGIPLIFPLPEGSNPVRRHLLDDGKKGESLLDGQLDIHRERRIKELVGG